MRKILACAGLAALMIMAFVAEGGAAPAIDWRKAPAWSGPQQKQPPPPGAWGDPPPDSWSRPPALRPSHRPMTAKEMQKRFMERKIREGYDRLLKENGNF